LPEAGEKLASVLREAAVETEGEFVEIGLQVSGSDGTLVGTAQPAFEAGR
jgi:hypothetical protein